MKWPSTRRTETEGLLYVEQIVNEHGSIFRRIHQEEDVGIDGIIEIVDQEKVQGLVIAVQIKSGESYVGSEGFVIYAGHEHIEYWKDFMLPVIVIAYSPSRKVACWTYVNRNTSDQQNSEDVNPTKVEIPFSSIFNKEAINRNLRAIARERKDSSLLFKAANYALGTNTIRKHQGLVLLSAHPQSIASRLTVHIASILILDENLDVATLAIQTLGLCIAQFKWERFYGRVDYEVLFYARECCFKFDERHILRMMEVITDGYFGGKSIGEACIDCIGFIPKSQQICRNIVLNKELIPRIRVNALMIFYAGNWNALWADEEMLRNDDLGDLLDWINSMQNK